jgi:hypothetical protein
MAWYQSLQGFVWDIMVQYGSIVQGKLVLTKLGLNQASDIQVSEGWLDILDESPAYLK